MDAQLASFIQARHKGVPDVYKFVNENLQEYYAIYHHHLTLNKEPVGENPRRNLKEVLSPEEKRYKTCHYMQMQGVSHEMFILVRLITGALSSGFFLVVDHTCQQNRQCHGFEECAYC